MVSTRPEAGAASAPATQSPEVRPAPNPRNSRRSTTKLEVARVLAVGIGPILLLTCGRDGPPKTGKQSLRNDRSRSASEGHLGIRRPVLLKAKSRSQSEVPSSTTGSRNRQPYRRPDRHTPWSHRPGGAP